LKYFSAKYITKKIPLILCLLGLSYCTLWVSGYSHLKQLEDDQHVGKTVLIYPSAGRFILDDSWYFGKKTGDSYFSSVSLITPPATTATPTFYKIVGKYQTVNHGAKIIAGQGVIQYLLIPKETQVNQRLFFFSLELCEAQTNLINPETDIKVDFICDGDN
jgi:hypothetical protein